MALLFDDWSSKGGHRKRRFAVLPLGFRHRALWAILTFISSVMHSANILFREFSEITFSQFMILFSLACDLCYTFVNLCRWLCKESILSRKYIWGDWFNYVSRHIKKINTINYLKNISLSFIKKYFLNIWKHELILTK